MKKLNELLITKTEKAMDEMEKKAVEKRMLYQGLEWKRSMKEISIVHLMVLDCLKVSVYIF